MDTDSYAIVIIIILLFILITVVFGLFFLIILREIKKTNLILKKFELTRSPTTTFREESSQTDAINSLPSSTITLDILNDFTSDNDDKGYPLLKKLKFGFGKSKSCDKVIHSEEGRSTSSETILRSLSF